MNFPISDDEIKIVLTIARQLSRRWLGRGIFCQARFKVQQQK
jgi:hypothetical protein